MEWVTYLLECADGSLYAGITNDVERRLAAHGAGTASRYTRGRRPVRLAYLERWPDRASASRREAMLKRLRRPSKLALAKLAPARSRVALSAAATSA